jgi:hypothetical protein
MGICVDVFFSDPKSVTEEELTFDENMKQACWLIVDNRRVTCDDVADWWEIIHGSVYELIHQKLHFYKVFAGLISRQFSGI